MALQQRLSAQFGMVPVQWTRDLRGMRLRVMNMYAAFSNDGFSYVSAQRIAKELSVTVSYVYRTIRQLVALGYLTPGRNDDDRRGHFLNPSGNVVCLNRTLFLNDVYTKSVQTVHSPSITDNLIDSRTDARESGPKDTMVAKVSNITQQSARSSEAAPRTRKANSEFESSRSAERLRTYLCQMTHTPSGGGHEQHAKYKMLLARADGDEDVARDIITQCVRNPGKVNRGEYAGSNITIDDVLYYARKWWKSTTVTNSERLQKIERVVADATRADGTISEDELQKGISLYGVLRHELSEKVELGIIARMQFSK